MADINIEQPAYPQAAGSFTMRSLSGITDFIVHHSAGPKSQTPLEIDAFERGNGDVYMPYTWLIDDAGTIFAGRPANYVSAATYGRNQESVAVCLIGDFQRDDAGYNGPPSAAALAALEALCLLAHKQFPSIVRTIVHGDVAAMFFGGDGNYATACCGDELKADVEQIRSRIAATLRKH
jgi:hypothetical protein